MHRPSSAKLWHIPMPPTVFPIPRLRFERTVPLDEHDTSYFADSVNMRNFSRVCSVTILEFYFLFNSLRFILHSIQSSYNIIILFFSIFIWKFIESIACDSYNFRRVLQNTFFSFFKTINDKLNSLVHFVFCLWSCPKKYISIRHPYGF